MVPDAPGPHYKGDGFPRASGDGPFVVLADKFAVGFPPRERGWSLPAAPSKSCDGVSPARAGMVPSAGSLSATAHGFPRASGDGPSANTASTKAGEFPPRERGWSTWAAHRGGQLGVSPARAGMVPDERAGGDVPAGFPRASGDGPKEKQHDHTQQTFPPRERGWSRNGSGLRIACIVSPARAGMVPWRRSMRRTSSSFPRASGDGPYTGGPVAQADGFPPRERGWSRIGAEGASVQGVSPARAGMQAARPSRTDRPHGFPRASGDAGRPSPTYYGWLCSRESLLRPQPAQEDSHAKAQKSP